MKSQNVCFFNSNLSWGGGEKWHYDVSTRLNRQGLRVFVAASKKSELWRRIQKTTISLFSISISNVSFLNPFKIYYIYNILKSKQIDTIIINLSKDIKAAGIAAKLAGTRRIIYRRGSATPIGNSFLNRLIFKVIPDAMIANSHHTKTTILQKNPKLFPHDKIQVIYNGIDLKNNSLKDTEPVYMRKNSEIILGHAGRLSPEKGQMDLIKVAGQLKKKNIPFKLLIAGEGKQKNELRQYTKSLDVEAEVLFLGFVQDIDAFMQTIDIFLLTSRYEGFGYVLVEAMAKKKPVVAFNIQSNSEIVEDGKTGFLIPGRNIEGFVEKVEYLFNNHSVRNQMGSAGKKRVEENFDIEKTTLQLLNFINSIE